MSIQSAMPPAQKPAKKRKKWPFVLGGLVVLLIVIIASSNSGGGTATPQPTGIGAGSELSSPAQAPASQQAQAPQQAAAEHTVVYKVTGTGTGKASSITYTTDGMTSSNQESDVKLPWQKTIKLPTGEAIQMVSILAQGSGKGTIAATIEVDGKVVKQASADGYGVAMANGNIGELGG